MSDDWRARQAGDDTPAAVAMFDGLDRIRREWPEKRPRICSGGTYVAGRDSEGRPKVYKTSRCDNEPDVSTGLCEACQGREKDAREAVRERAEPKEAPTGRARFQR